MKTYWLRFVLCSDATFGRGEGLAGLVNQEVEHDAFGLPYLRGRALKGLLNEECANILYTIGEPERFSKTKKLGPWGWAAHRLFGGPGSTHEDIALMRVGDARLPRDLRAVVRREVKNGMPAADVLESLTAIRRQTAVNAETGVSEDKTLRAMRVILRETPFEARLGFVQPPNDDDLALLAACVLAFRRAGTGRNRGRGRLRAGLYRDAGGRPDMDDDAFLQDKFVHFAETVKGEKL